MVIRRIGPLSLARISGMLYAIIGLVLGAIFSFLSLVGFFNAGLSDEAEFPAFLGVASIVILPVLYGGFGFLATLAAGWLYNFLAGVVGGIELDLQ